MAPCLPTFVAQPFAMKLSLTPILPLDIFQSFNDTPECGRLYFVLYQQIPSVQQLENINATRIKEWLAGDYRSQVLNRILHQDYHRRIKRMMYESATYILQGELIVQLKPDAVSVYHHEGVTEQADALIKLLKKFILKRRPKREFSLVISGERGLETTSLAYQKPSSELVMNYNTDIVEAHPRVLALLKKKNKSGLYLFHGEPGTGKSTYIRYLIHSTEKKVIYMPPALAQQMDSPALTRFMTNQRDAIFIIEDAEELIASRDHQMNPAASVLLNLTDGLLGESLGIQVIATFNTHLRNIDPAFLRKGRLLQLLEFKPLAVEKAQALLEKLGHTDVPVTRPMSLADLYHFDQQAFSQPARQQSGIGFMANHTN